MTTVDYTAHAVTGQKIMCSGGITWQDSFTAQPFSVAAGGVVEKRQAT